MWWNELELRLQVLLSNFTLLFITEIIASNRPTIRSSFQKYSWKNARTRARPLLDLRPHSPVHWIQPSAALVSRHFSGITRYNCLHRVFASECSHLVGISGHTPAVTPTLLRIRLWVCCSETQLHDQSVWPRMMPRMWFEWKTRSARRLCGMASISHGHSADHTCESCGHRGIVVGQLCSFGHSDWSWRWFAIKQTHGNG